MKKDRRPLTIDDITYIAREATLMHGGHISMVIAEGDVGGVSLPIPELADTHEGRANQMYLAGMFIAKMGDVGVLQQVFFISEGWFSVAKDGKPSKQLPSQDPKRKEVLTISHQDLINEKTQMQLLEMKRDEKGELRSLVPLAEPTNQEVISVEAPLLNAFIIGFLGLSQEVDD